MSNMRILKYIQTDIAFKDPDTFLQDTVLDTHDFILAMKQRDEKIKEEYEAFNDMHNADGVNTASKHGRSL